MQFLSDKHLQSQVWHETELLRREAMRTWHKKIFRFFRISVPALKKETAKFAPRRFEK